MLPLLAAAVFTQTDVKLALQSEYGRWTKAYAARDAETLIGMLSPDFTQLGASKQPITCAEFAAKLRLLKDAPKDRSTYSVALQRLTVRGDEVDAVAVESTETPMDSKRVGIHRHELLDTWIRYDTTWRLRRSIVTKESTEVRVRRGKPVGG